MVAEREVRRMSPAYVLDRSLRTKPCSCPAAGLSRPGSGNRPARPGSHLPVARVLVESSLPHLDRPFDYSVPAGLDD
jgi:hypothetical protein